MKVFMNLLNIASEDLTPKGQDIFDFDEDDIMVCLDTYEQNNWRWAIGPPGIVRKLRTGWPDISASLSLKVGRERDHSTGERNRPAKNMKPNTPNTAAYFGDSENEGGGHGALFESMFKNESDEKKKKKLVQGELSFATTKFGQGRPGAQKRGARRLKRGVAPAVAPTAQIGNDTTGSASAKRERSLSSSPSIYGAKKELEQLKDKRGATISTPQTSSADETLASPKGVRKSAPRRQRKGSERLAGRPRKK